MTQNYYQIHCTCAQVEAEALVEFLEEKTNALSVSLEDAQDEPLFEPKPDEMPLWSQVKITALYTEELSAIKALVELQKHYSELSISEVESLVERDWVTETQAQFQPQCFGGKLWLYPAWETIPVDHFPVIQLSPGLAFGTGTHPTTQMCLQALVEFVQPMAEVIDFGCGSGILALAALKLGAQKVYAVDIDPQALEATSNNAALNAIQPEALWIGSSHDLNGARVDILVANILAQPLIELSPLFKKLLKPTGKIILAGLLDDQVNRVIEAYANWKEVTVFAQQDEWVCLVG